MPRYDKYDPYDGGFRAPIAAAVTAADGFNAYAVGLNSNGRVVLGAGNTGIVGIMIPHGAKKVGDIVDVMTDGEIVEWTADGKAPGESQGADATAGTIYKGAKSTGAVASTGDVELGFTSEKTRLIVRVQREDQTGA